MAGLYGSVREVGYKYNFVRRPENLSFFLFFAMLVATGVHENFKGVL